MCFCNTINRQIQRSLFVLYNTYTYLTFTEHIEFDAVFPFTIYIQFPSGTLVDSTKSNQKAGTFYQRCSDSEHDVPFWMAIAV